MMRLMQLFALLLTVVSSAHATLIDVDAFQDGAYSGFRTSNSSLLWLDIGFNSSQSYNEVLSEIHSGEPFDGWRVPTEKEVVAMWADIVGEQYEMFLSGNYYLNVDSDLTKQNYWQMMARIIGVTAEGFGDTGYWFSAIAVFENEAGLLRQSNFYHNQVTGELSGEIRVSDLFELSCDPLDTACSGIGIDYRNDPLLQRSTFLVKDTVSGIPAPGTFPLLALGALLLICTRQSSSLTKSEKNYYR